MIRLVWFILLGLVNVALNAQTPQPRVSWDDKPGTTGHTLIVNGKTFGPYKDVDSYYYSTNGQAIGFIVLKRDKAFVVAAGAEFGPLPADDKRGWLYVADDNKFWGFQADKYDASGNLVSSQFFANGKVYGPYQEIRNYYYADKGGQWLAEVRVNDKEVRMLVNGKETKSYRSIEHLWVSADSSQWGYLATNDDESMTLVTQDGTQQDIRDANFKMMYPRAPHWAYAYRVGEGPLVLVVDGKAYKDYSRFDGLVVGDGGQNWGFSGEKMSEAGDFGMVYIAGKEYVGENLYITRYEGKETFYWTIRDGYHSTVMALPAN